MRSGGIPNFVDGVHCRIQSSIVTNRIVGSENIIVNGSWNTDDSDSVFFAENFGTSESTVSTDADQCINSALYQVFVRFFSTFGSFEFQRTCGFQNSSAFGDDVFHRSGSHSGKVVVD
ncbi:hypothetical protein SDC9_178893 [bioreactor metagenome]|uniref:Uncharacterized protein n=1 Tax=bioreactor metagenome TaxID=1076179 RepID=A0A645H0B2_9ZZZZ